MADEHFCLKWNNFQSSIVTAFGSLQSTEDLADVTLTCEGSSIKAHKVILSACSPYFRTVFKENPCPHPIVILKDVLHSDLLAVLNFMYHGEVLITQDKLVSFLQTAEALQVSGLVATAALHDLPLKLTSSALKPGVKTNKRVKAKAKIKTSTKTTDSPILSSSNQKEIDTEVFETVTVEGIKTEVLEEFHGDHNFNDKIDAYDNERKLESSILETVLEVKENQPSILERSLTSHASKSPSSLTSHILDNVTSVIHLSSPETHRKSDFESEKRSLKHKLTESLTQRNIKFDTDTSQQKIVKLDDEAGKHVEFNIQGFPNDISVVNVRSAHDMQPHHSSQCGNCPHCGKVYSNQSALKYHVRLVHSDLTNMYCCHLCPESFDYREGYKNHMVDVHSIRN